MNTNLAQWKLALTLAVIALGLAASPAAAAGPDPGFGTGGRADLSMYKKSGVHTMEASKNSIFVGSGLGNLIRLDAYGNLDPSFGGDSWASIAPYLRSIRGTPYGASMAVQQDGKVLVAGSYGTRPLLSRLTADGNLDSGFGQRGAILCRKSFVCNSGQLTDVEVDGRGRIVVSGFLRSGSVGNSSTWSFVRRYRPSGNLDRSFARRGQALFKGVDAAGVLFRGLEITRKGRIVVLRLNSKGASAIELRQSGRLDRRFAKRKVSLRLPYAFDLDSVPGGRIMAFGVSSGSSSSEVARGCARLYAFNWAGRLSGGFSRDGRKCVCLGSFGRTFPSFDGTPKGVYTSTFTLQSNASSVVTLGLTGKPALGDLYTFRVRPNGAVDRTFTEQAGLFHTGVTVGEPVLEGLHDGVLAAGGILDDDFPREPGSFIYRFVP